MQRTTIEVDRAEPRRTQALTEDVPALGEGEALLRIEAIGLSANVVTYARLAERFGYWRFFPAADPAGPWGRLPAWGVATCIASESTELWEGERVVGFVPLSSHLVVRPRKAGIGWLDTSPHRRELPAAYNAYRAVPDALDGDALTRSLVLRPLAPLAALVADELEGTAEVVVTSASSKASIALAHLLGRAGVAATGLTSKAHLKRTQATGAFREVLPYGSISRLAPATPAALADVAGEPGIRASVHRKLRDGLARSLVLGATHARGDAFAEVQEAGVLPGPAPQAVFVPDLLAARAQAEGLEAVDARVEAALGELVAWSEAWLEAGRASGAEPVALRWRSLLAGELDPHVALVASL